LDLFPERHREFVEKHILPVTRGNFRQKGMPSTFFSYYILEALKKTRYAADALDCVKRWWSKLLAGDKTTTPEHWVTKAGCGSMCHAWSAHPIIHLSNMILGIYQTSAGWDTVRFEPLFQTGDFARGKVATPHGVIASRWKKTDGGIQVSLKLPPKITAEAVLPGRKKELVRGRIRWTLRSVDLIQK
jgi:alpha-L-rhamnosidase